MRPGRKQTSPQAIPKNKATISLTRQEIYRLDILASHWSLERGRNVTRSDVVSELIRPHLRTVVVSVRGGQVGEEEAAA